MANLALVPLLYLVIGTATVIGHVVGVWLALRIRGHRRSGLTTALTAVMALTVMVYALQWNGLLLYLLPAIPAIARFAALRALTRDRATTDRLAHR
ncbi:MAG: hypothetical protein M3N57_08935 [Actinomycetota bacterium]|nr:hypothetical protein [Actinomycetota bacterium]